MSNTPTRADDIKTILSWDYSHTYVTDPAHLVVLHLETRNLAHRIKRQVEALDIGTFEGHSAAAMALAGASVATVDIDFNGSMPKLLNTYGITSTWKMTGLDKLKEPWKHDVIFHDSEHGEHMIPEFRLAWNRVRPGGFLAIHDVDQIDAFKFIGSLDCVARHMVLVDGRDRRLAFIHKHTL